ncbi:serine hydrolase [Chryseolinea sp. H1M3-3]|uniref:serine hydrolase n=1 Tax=Chryseolinea sp. H1M3-3 TaxID=3034144 RepID=UPI0023EC2CAD|nr:serine hydrolase [Chryseolinea sp. H1M3-3]
MRSFRISKLIVGLFIILTIVVDAKGQVTHSYSEIKDTIIARFNRNDFKGIYQLFDTSFSNKISETKLVNFLKGNQNSGKIIQSSFLAEKNGKYSYLLEFELRDMIMNLSLTGDNKISSFGLLNSPEDILASPPVVKSNNPKKSSLDMAIDSAALEYFRYSKANSLTIGIIKNGKKYIYTYGETEKGNGELPTSNTLYEIGSITKTFTSTVLAQAVLDKKVFLTDDIRKYLPGNFPNLNYNGKPITLLDLANHTSGLPSLPADIGDKANYDALNPESHYDSTMVYDALRRVSIDTIPGHKFLYSNWGISLLGHILEKVYRQPLSSLIRTYVTTPFAMKSTLNTTSETGQNVAVPHSENGKRIPLANEGYFSPAGGLCSTINDMLCYLNAQLNEKEASIKLTHGHTANNMGLGWGVRKNGLVTELQHNGATQGSTAHISAFLELNSGCVILVNNKVNMGKLIIRIQRIVKNALYK